MSEEGKSLIRKLLVVDPQIRLTPDQALKDVWFTKFRHIQIGSEEDKLDPAILNKLKEYRGVSKLKKTALNLLIKMVSQTKDVEILREAFTKLDHGQTGYITVVELKLALTDASMKFDEEEIDRIVKEVDYLGNNKINYSEFLAATLSINKILTNERLLAIFKQFDSEDTGYITPQGIYAAI